MKLIIASILVVAVAADRLENTYLPPSSAQTAGGSGDFLNSPHHGSVRPSEKYGAPSGGRFGGSGSTQPQPIYGAPSGFAGGKFGGQSRDAGAKIVRYNNENIGDGSYKFDFETENGIAHQESGELKNQETSFVQGSYSYTGDDGKVITVNYIADENGFQPSGDHLPTSPPIPEAIQKSLEIIAAQGGNNKAYQGQGYQSNGQNFNQQTGYQY